MWREVREETGYHATVEGLLGIHSCVIPEGRRIAPDAVGPMHALRIVYRARVSGGRLRNERSGSTDRAEWFTLEDVGSLQRVKLVVIAIRMAAPI